MTTNFTLEAILPGSAERVVALVRTAQDDNVVKQEFPNIFTRYLEFNTAAQYIQERYHPDNHINVGYLILPAYTNITDTEKAIGMAAFGHQDEALELPNGQLKNPRGVNFSVWLLEEYRGSGIGKNVMRFIVDNAKDHIDNPPNQSWQDRILWTGIRVGNVASERIVTNLGFHPVGTMVREPEYKYYVTAEEAKKYGVVDKVISTIKK